jgi:tetratricopeptide (TPR) repeat protein
LAAVLADAVRAWEPSHVRGALRTRVIRVVADQPVDFFVSYSSADHAWAQWIAWQLEQAGYSTLIQAWDFRPGSNFVLEMDRATGQAERTIAVLSPAFLESPYTSAEWAAAFREDPTGERRKLVPVRVRACEPGRLLGSVVWIDLVELSEDEARERLLSGLSPARRKPREAAPFPGEAQLTASRHPTFPLPGPTIWNVPVATRTFSGRRGALDRLVASLHRDGSVTVTQAQAIHGLGGVGKTQLAARYAREHQDEYDVVWWVRAEQQDTRLSDYAELAHRLGLVADANDDLEAARAAAKTWLERSHRWLLVFDNASEPAELHCLMPEGSGGHILITSRAHADWRAVGAEPIALDVFTRDESHGFLQDRTGQADEDAAEVLAEALGDLPLALEQAASYVNRQAIDIATYCRRLWERAPELFAQDRPLDYEHTVATTWSMSFDLVRVVPGASDVVCLCGYLASERIPRELIDRWLRQHQPEASADQVTEALLSVGLVAAADDDAVNMHRLVQRVARSRMTTEQRQGVAAQTVALLLDAFPADAADPSAWETCSALVPHVLAVVDRPDANVQGSAAIADLLSKVATFRQGRAEFEAARAAAERALDLHQRVHGPDHPQVAATLTRLATALDQLGETEPAQGALERALRINERHYGPTHPETATTLMHLAAAFARGGKLEKARKVNERALAVTEKCLGADHPQAGAILRNLGIVLDQLGDPYASLDHLERAVSVTAHALGDEHVEVAATLVNLGSVLRALGRGPQARDALLRALAISESAFGPEHPYVAASLGNLGSLLDELGDHAAAADLNRRALQISRQVYGPAHPHTAIRLAKLAVSERNLGRIDEAREHLLAAARITEATRGPEHHDLAGILANLGSVLHDAGEHQDALRALCRSLEIERTAVGATSAGVATTLVHIAITQQSMGDLAAAEASLSEALDIQRQLFRDDHPTVAVTLFNQGLVLIRSGRPKEAVSAFTAALAINERIFGGAHPTVANTLLGLAAALDESGDLDAAEGARERARLIQAG